jgi:hypothetical protein
MPRAVFVALAVLVALAAVILKTAYDMNEFRTFEPVPLHCQHIEGINGAEDLVLIAGTWRSTCDVA